MTVHVTALNWTECVVEEGRIIKNQPSLSIESRNIRILLIAIFLKSLHRDIIEDSCRGLYEAAYMQCKNYTESQTQAVCSISAVAEMQYVCLLQSCSKLVFLVWSNRWCNPAIQPIITARIKLVDGAGNWLVSLVICDEKSIFFIQKNGSCCTMMTR